MTEQIVSVVIPTHGRPEFLPRAVDSVFECQGNDSEVIVVPNGPDKRWQQVVAQWADDERVHIAPLEEANGNAARNHGMSLATGRYLRFLDDDDYLLPGAVEQVRSIENAAADVCGGGIRVLNHAGEPRKERFAPAYDDFAACVLSPHQVPLPHTYLYRREKLAKSFWDEDVALGQDKRWLYAACENGDLEPCYVANLVGVWFQHDGERLSHSYSLGTHGRARFDLLMSCAKTLESQGRLTDNRASLAAEHLWKIVFGAYSTAPTFWERRLKEVRAMFPASEPPQWLFRYDPLGILPARAYLRLLAPLKKFKHRYVNR